MNKALYVHVPFCKHICFYCDFCRFPYTYKNAKLWLEAFKKEVKERLDFLPYSIYLGGGTPTSLDADLLDEFLASFDSLITDQEYTIEINPETLDKEKVKLLKKHHVNRASIGMQSSSEDELKLMGRKHNYKDVKSAISLLKEEGIDNISVDLMYSLPNQNFSIFQKSIEDALALDIKHLSLYSLTIEENSVFAKRNYQHLDDDQEADYYEYACKRLKEAGFRQYEVANFCKENYESKHNLVYWHYEDFLGLSLGASGKSKAYRYDNTRDFNKYLNGQYLENEYFLKEKEEMFEMLMMNLRLEEGLSLERFKEFFNKDLLDVYKKEIEEGLISKELRLENDHLIVNNREVLNTVLLRFLNED